jgi:hypothetical protein
MSILDRLWKPNAPRPPRDVLCGYHCDEATGRLTNIVLPEHVRRMKPWDFQRWRVQNKVVLQTSGGAMSWWQTFEPWDQADGPTTALSVSEQVLSQDTILTLPQNWFGLAGKRVWFRAMGKMSNVVTTPGTVTFKLRWSTPGVGITGNLLATTGAIPFAPVAATDNLWWVDVWVVCEAPSQTTTSLSLLAYGQAHIANIVDPGTTGADRLSYMPPAGTALANVTTLDGTVQKALTLTVTFSVATAGTVATVRDCWITALN